MSTSPDPTPSDSPHSKTSAWQVLGHALHLFAVLAGLKLGFDFSKSEYEVRVKYRTEKMLSDGLIEETRNILTSGFEQWAPLRSVGYRETVCYLRENKNRNWLSEAVSQSTMKLIKKQKTWFKRDGTVLWSKHDGHLQQFLGPA